MPLLDTLCDGVGPVCHELNIAPSTYYRHREYRQHPEKRSLRDRRDDLLRPEIQRVYGGNYSVYGIRKVWRQLQREGFSVARCTIARLMKAMGLAGVLRGKKVRTTVSRKDVAASDRVNRQFVAERPQSALGGRFHVRQHLAGLRICRVHHRCVRRRYFRLAGIIVYGDNVRTGCAGAGTVGTSTFRHHPSLG